MTTSSVWLEKLLIKSEVTSQGDSRCNRGWRLRWGRDCCTLCLAFRWVGCSGSTLFSLSDCVCGSSGLVILFVWNMKIHSFTNWKYIAINIDTSKHINTKNMHVWKAKNLMNYLAKFATFTIAYPLYFLMSENRTELQLDAAYHQSM